MKNKNFGRKRQAIYILSNRKSTRIIKTLMDFFFFIKVKIKMVCFSVPSLKVVGGAYGKRKDLIYEYKLFICVETNGIYTSDTYNIL